MGSDGKALLDLHGIQTMADTPTFEVIETQQLERDVRLRCCRRLTESLSYGPETNMFTGIVESIGKVVSLERIQEEWRLTLQTGSLA